MSQASNKAARSQKEIRLAGRRSRASLGPGYRECASWTIAEKVCRSHWFARAQRIACYLPVGDEVDTWPIIARAWQMKKRVFVPVVQENMNMKFREITAESDLQRSSFALYEPLSGEFSNTDKLDIVITPLVAFDENMNRVGMGGGCYDRTFVMLKHRKSYLHPKLVGVAFACQEVEEINANAWDIPLFQVITER